jgi:hypothetical protein
VVHGDHDELGVEAGDHDGIGEALEQIAFDVGGLDARNALAST